VTCHLQEEIEKEKEKEKEVVGQGRLLALEKR
jgi:hypothetical protein